MINHKTIQFLFILFALVSCNSKKQDDGKTYNTSYEVGPIPLLKNFQQLDSTEEKMDSIFSDFGNDASDHPEFKNTFLHNRSRIYMDPGSHNDLYAAETNRAKGFPAYCDCNIYNDTIYITTGIGFFGGAGFNIQVFEKNFTSSFFIYTDDIKPYKSHLSDTAFANNATVNSKFQYLVLDRQPAYEPDQQLTGFFTYTSERYYELKSGNTLDSSYVTGKIYFTCETKPVQEERWSQ